MNASGHAARVPRPDRAKTIWSWQHSRLRSCNPKNELFAIAFEDSFLKHCRLIPWGLVRFTPGKLPKSDFQVTME
jgi:hypothetical protein